MKLSEKDQSLLGMVRTAIEFAENGDPINDVMDDADIREALELLIKFDDERLSGQG